MIQHPDEEYGDGYSNSFQRAHAQSALTADRGTENRFAANKLVAAGRFVVVCFAPMYCRSTDGLIGQHFSIVEDYATRKEAEAGLNAVYSCDPDDCSYHIWPALPTAPPVFVVEDSGAPF